MKKLSVLFIALMALLVACQQPDVSYAKIESMEFESDSYTLQENDEMTMAYRLTILPAEVGDTVTVKWSIADPSIATISDFGTLQALREGKTTLTASAMGVKASCEIVVEPLKIKEFSIPSALTVYANEPTEIEIADLSPKKAPLYRINWESTDKEVMPELVDNKKWMLTTDKIGTYTLTAITGKLEPRTCQVTVKIRPITTFTLSDKNLYLLVGQKDTLQLTMAPDNASYKDIEWRSTNDKVVTVNQNGVLEAVGEGEAVVMVTHYAANESDKFYEEQCNVTVAKSPAVTSVDVSPTSLTMKRGDVTFVSINNIQPAGALATTLKWEIADPSIAKIAGGTANGLKKQINALKAGTTTLTISSASGYKKTVSITVNPISATGVTIPEADSKACVWAGTSYTFGATLQPSNTDDKLVYAIYTTTSNARGSASISGNKITFDAEAEGGFVISVKAISPSGTTTVSQSFYIYAIQDKPMNQWFNAWVDNRQTDYYGTFGMYENITHRVKVPNMPTNIQITNVTRSLSGSSYHSVIYNSAQQRLYYVKQPVAKPEKYYADEYNDGEVNAQLRSYGTMVTYKVKITDSNGLTKSVDGIPIYCYATCLGYLNWPDAKSSYDETYQIGHTGFNTWYNNYVLESGALTTVNASKTKFQMAAIYVGPKTGSPSTHSIKIYKEGSEITWTATGEYKTLLLGQGVMSQFGYSTADLPYIRYLRR